MYKWIIYPYRPGIALALLTNSSLAPPTPWSDLQTFRHWKKQTKQKTRKQLSLVWNHSEILSRVAVGRQYYEVARLKRLRRLCCFINVRKNKQMTLSTSQRRHPRHSSPSMICFSLTRLKYLLVQIRELQCSQPCVVMLELSELTLAT